MTVASNSPEHGAVVLSLGVDGEDALCWLLPGAAQDHHRVQQLGLALPEPPDLQPR